MSVSTIHILPDYLANQIAAGEVVQRPESVVKELVENAIDSGATSVSVVVREAGKKLIHVIDDGSGMSKDDLELCVVRHATSKISSDDDLHSIRTLGFRGEALASIAAVADVEIRTRRREEENGWTLQSHPAQVPEVKPSAVDGGSQVIVRNLFYQVPARKKFLKSDLTEFRHVSETMQRMALSRPDLRFTFHDADAMVFDVKPSDLKKRILEVLAIDAPRHLVHVMAQEGGISIEGYAGLPAVARQSRSGQFLFLNNRSIVSRSLGHAVSTAYEHLLDPGQHPVFVLHLVVDPHRVDVNVHPQKHEVKFEDEHAVYLIVQRAVTEALRKAEVIPSFLGDVQLAARPLQIMPGTGGSAPSLVNRLTGEILPAGSTWKNVPNYRSEHITSTQRQSVDELFRKQEESLGDVVHLGGQFVVTSSAEGMVVIDQHAAHERILFERIMRRLPQDAQKGQALLFSVKVNVSPSRSALLREYLDELSALGFRLEILSNGSVEVNAVPSDVRPGNEEVVLDEILQSLELEARMPRDRRREGVAAVFAAQQAMRRGDRLSGDEMRTLVKDLFACHVPHLTPTGKPTYIVISLDELVQRFA